mmetsp:Transcript_5503/g.8626  ORF Transcript_5503/g.8626 Transcript_5503/m.8626 type:complete len:132 (-) Transcript_5503:1518-1913(-)
MSSSFEGVINQHDFNRMINQIKANRQHRVSQEGHTFKDIMYLWEQRCEKLVQKYHYYQDKYFDHFDQESQSNARKATLLKYFRRMEDHLFIERFHKRLAHKFARFDFIQGRHQLVRESLHAIKTIRECLKN